MKSQIRIGDISVTKGNKATGFLNVFMKADGSHIRIPLFIINGIKDGPTLCVSAGIHGDEYEPMETVRLVSQNLRPDDLKGVFIGVPIVNIPAFEAGSRLNPIDNMNLNRAFPGRMDGTASERIAYTFLNEVISKSDYYFDIHSGGVPLSMEPLTIYEEAEGELGKKALDLAKAIGLDVLWKFPYTGTATSEAVKKGIPAALLDGLGCEGRFRNRYVELGVKCVNNLMKNLGMIKGKPELPSNGWTIFEGDCLRSRSCGFLRLNVELNEKVKKGDIVAKVLDPFGNEVDRIASPYHGHVLLLRSQPSIRAGDWAVFVGKMTRKVKNQEQNKRGD